jgi:hypothetical protein
LAPLLKHIYVVEGLDAVGVNGPHIYFSGANIHIVSGSTATADTVTGLGNLIIGYDEDPAAIGIPLNPGDRGGSHNLVIGRWNRFTNAAFGGLVAGEGNTISNRAAIVSGGNGNTASGIEAIVNGGNSNTASGFVASVSGGQANTASGALSVVLGGSQNTASGPGSGPGCSVSGGQSNAASGAFTVVIGAQSVTDNKNFSIAPSPPFP